MYKGKKVYLCAFYNLDLYPSAVRFKKQAESFNIFDEIFIYNEYNLPYDEKFESFLRNKLILSRGFGYWCWKPFIVLKTLESINDSDILFYADIGCHFNKDRINRFYEYLDMVIDNEKLCFELPYIEKAWTKSDLFNYFNVLDDKNITDTFQRPSGAFWFVKNDVNMEFIKKWLQVYYDDFSLIDDTPSKLKNSSIFVENRHDQSVFSILSKIYNFHTINSMEFDPKNSNKFPINALRDKKSISDMFLSDEFYKFVNRLLWFIPHRATRHNLRYRIKEHYFYFIISYLIGSKKEYNDKIINIPFLGSYLQNKTDKIVRKSMNDNIIKYRDEIEDIINYIHTVNISL